MEDKNILIGLTGKAGSGKSISANFLKRVFDMKEYVMADPLKKIGMIIGFSENEMYGTQEQKLEINTFWGISGRQFMQKFGTEICRDLVPEIIPQMSKIWIKLLEKFLSENTDKNLIVSDVRFIDEVEAIRNNGGKIIEIVRPPIPHDEHLSENLKFNADFTVVNDGKIEELFTKLLEIINI
jgi:dephospho-CoA kinase